MGRLCAVCPSGYIVGRLFQKYLHSFWPHYGSGRLSVVSVSLKRHEDPGTQGYPVRGGEICMAELDLHEILAMDARKIYPVKISMRSSPASISPGSTVRTRGYPARGNTEKSLFSSVSVLQSRFLRVHREEAGFPPGGASRLTTASRLPARRCISSSCV